MRERWADEGEMREGWADEGGMGGIHIYTRDNPYPRVHTYISA
jgi:hypothetical protein